MKRIAHRGIQTRALENTLEAAQETFMDVNVAGLEIDLRLTLDKKPVVFHDASLKRLCGLPECIDNVAYYALPPILDNRESRQPDRIPQLVEILDILPPDKELWLDLKGSDACLAEEVGKVLLQYAALHANLRVLLFREEWISILRRHLPDIDIQLMACYSKEYYTCNPCIRRIESKEELRDFIEDVEKQGVTSISLEWSAFISREIVDLVHARRLKLGLWEGLASKGLVDAKAAEDLGIDYITVNI